MSQNRQSQVSYRRDGRLEGRTAFQLFNYILSFASVFQSRNLVRDSVTSSVRAILKR